jgi:hypothetical protein
MRSAFSFICRSRSAPLRSRLCALFESYFRLHPLFLIDLLLSGREHIICRTNPEWGWVLQKERMIGSSPILLFPSFCQHLRPIKRMHAESDETKYANKTVSGCEYGSFM